MVDRTFGRRSLCAAIVAGFFALALASGPVWAQAVADPLLPGQPEVPVLPSKEAAPPRLRMASRQPLASGEAPLPPGLTNKSSDLRNLPSSTNPSLSGMTGLSGQEVVVKVIIDPPLKHTPEHVVRRYIKTMSDRPYDLRTVEDDVLRLGKSKLFAPGSVHADYQRVGEHGINVIYHVVEYPTLKYVRFYGQQKVKERHLKKQSGLKEGDARDPMNIRDGATKVEDYYHEKGFNKATVKVLEGTGNDDRGAVFLVNEGQKQKIAKVEFEGNLVAPDGRLKAIVQSKPPLLWVFKGEVERQKIEEDIGRLYEYYRNLGYFGARISHELIWNEDQNWLTIRFVIDEGPRYKVRSIRFIGQQLFTAEQLSEKLKLNEGDFFDKGKLDKDKLAIQDKYGMKGYVFAEIQQEPKYSPNPEEVDQIDLVYQISEGKPCIVSRVNVHISGDNPHTRRNTILNRVSLHPGDLLSTRELRDSERRLKASTLFKATPGDEPKIEFKSPDLEQDTGLAEKPGGRGGFRGQSPDAPKREAR